MECRSYKQNEDINKKEEGRGPKAKKSEKLKFSLDIHSQVYTNNISPSRNINWTLTISN